MIKIIRELLLKIIDNIDSGNSNIDDDDALSIIEMLKKYTDRDIKMSKYMSCRYLNVSRATFDNYVREGKIQRGRHEIGFKELFYYKKDLDRFINECKKDSKN